MKSTFWMTAQEAEDELKRREIRPRLACKHCDKLAEWKWTDADGNEFSLICERCMTTLPFYIGSTGMAV